MLTLAITNVVVVVCGIGGISYVCLKEILQCIGMWRRGEQPLWELLFVIVCPPLAIAACSFLAYLNMLEMIDALNLLR